MSGGTVDFEIDVDGHHVRPCVRCGAKKRRFEMNRDHCNDCRKPRGRKRKVIGVRLGLCDAVKRVNESTGLRLPKNALHRLVQRGKMPIAVHVERCDRLVVDEADMAALIAHFKPRC